jgi:hypothetical protein
MPCTLCLTATAEERVCFYPPGSDAPRWAAVCLSCCQPLLAAFRAQGYTVVGIGDAA